MVGFVVYNPEQKRQSIGVSMPFDMFWGLCVSCAARMLSERLVV